MHAHRHESSHTTSGLQSGLPRSLLLPLVTVKRRQPSSGKPSLNLYCIYWSAGCILLFICPCGWNSVCYLCEDVKLSLWRRYFWRHLLSQLKPVCGEIIRVKWGVLQGHDDLINQVMQKRFFFSDSLLFLSWKVLPCSYLWEILIGVTFCIRCIVELKNKFLCTYKQWNLAIQIASVFCVLFYDTWTVHFNYFIPKNE